MSCANLKTFGQRETLTICDLWFQDRRMLAWPGSPEFSFVFHGGNADSASSLGPNNQVHTQDSS